MASTPVVHPYKLPTGRSYLGLITKRAYRIPLRGPAEPLPDAPPIHSKIAYVPSTSPTGMRRLLHDSDLFCCAKPVTDVLLLGSAHSLRGRVQSIDTAIEVGPVKKAVRVHGDRRVERGPDDALRFGPAEGFESMPVDWDHAYGGRDLHAEDLRYPKPRGALDPRAKKEEVHGALCYPRNYAGRGFMLGVNPERIMGTLAPNLEDPNHPITADRLILADLLDWMDAPVSAAYGPIDLFTFPRALFALRPAFNPPKRRLHELDAGAVTAADLVAPLQLTPPSDPRGYACAPAGLAVRRLEGAERVKLWNLHREREYVELDLPADRPTLILEPPGVAPRRLEALLQTVLIEPDEGRITLTWAGVLETAMIYPKEMAATMRHAVTWPR
ncbi:MAG: DUF2169 domain-containing protein [Byssovorax sp.]